MERAASGSETGVMEQKLFCMKIYANTQFNRTFA